MDNVKNYPFLRQMILRMLLIRLFIPLIGVTFIVGIGAEYLGKRHIENSQKQVIQSVSHIVEYHIEHGGRVLDAVARTAETSEKSNLTTLMNSTWEAYGYFETIYCLDKENKITSMAPSNPGYIGLDMSNLSDIKESKEKDNLIISRPFISLRTGDPIVYLVRPLSQGGYIVGEFNLGLFQEEIENISNINGEDFVFIMDQTGTLIAHPSSSLVNEQTNMSNLGIFHNTLSDMTKEMYLYNEKLMIGSAAKVEKTGWIVVDQEPLSKFISSYAWVVMSAILAMFVIFIALVLSFRKQIQRYVITPLEQLTKSTNALAIGDFNNGNSLPSISTTFVEIHNLMVDFELMSDNLRLRETALIESENRNRGLVERLPIGVFRATYNGQILGLNPMAEFMLGYSECEELSESNIINFLVTSLRDKQKEQFLLENIYQLNNFEMQIKTKKEKNIWIQINSHIAYDFNEQIEFLEGSIKDITERKETEFKIKEQQELLFNSEKEKREALERALVMKDEFISLISHEFKTPLNVIYSAIQLIECVYLDKIPERVKQLIGNIKQNTFRQLRLTNNLLDITKMNSGEIKFNKKNIDIVFLTKVIAQSVEPYANQKNINMNFKSNTESKIMSVDEEKFERIILNILSNAMKFTESGGDITITINEKIRSKLIQIKISDTGIGIPKEKKDFIFERFGQVDSNLSRRAEGTGIGLSLVKLLVDKLGGTIEVESELGVGSTFILTLPVNKEVLDNESEVRLDVDDRLVSEIKVEFSDIYL